MSENRIAMFEKVSYHEFRKSLLEQDLPASFSEVEIQEIYDNIRLPQRSTFASAGYDFYAPFNLNVMPGESIKIPTGIRCKIEDNWFLGILPRGGQGFKYGIRLANTMGVIDADYYNSDNEGHIFIKLINSDDRSDVLSVFKVTQSIAFAQGIFLMYGITYDDNCANIRNGGFGSTGM